MAFPFDSNFNNGFNNSMSNHLENRFGYFKLKKTKVYANPMETEILNGSVRNSQEFIAKWNYQSFKKGDLLQTLMYS